MRDPVVAFEEWEKVLKDTVPVDLQAAYRESVVKFRYWLREKNAAATAEAFKEHLAWKKSYLPPEKFELRRQALRWYWQKGRALRGSAVGGSWPVVGGQTREPASADKIPALRPEGPAGGKRVGPADNRGLAPNNQRPTTNNQMNDVPTRGAADLGGAPWERKMVVCIRARHLAWTTETTYRSWARRLVRFCQPKAAEDLEGKDVQGFLSHLAVKERVSSATQRQALNAGVFLLREVFRKNPGDFGDFARPPRHLNVPSVLSREECARLFEQLEGTTRLMAELMYGAGLRLNELLRLRIKDMDLERLQLSVRAGKGNKDRLTMIPRSLAGPLRAHRERVRGLHEKDREAGQPGVELPEALERKWPKAGEKFEWFWFSRRGIC